MKSPEAATRIDLPALRSEALAVIEKADARDPGTYLRLLEVVRQVPTVVEAMLDFYAKVLNDNAAQQAQLAAAEQRVAELEAALRSYMQAARDVIDSLEVFEGCGGEATEDEWRTLDDAERAAKRLLPMEPAAPGGSDA